MIPASDIDQVLLSHCDADWLKVARIVGRTQKTLEERGVQITLDQIAARLEDLVEAGQLEAKGNIQNWRYSEVRLTASPQEAG